MLLVMMLDDVNNDGLVMMLDEPFHVETLGFGNVLI